MRLSFVAMKIYILTISALIGLAITVAYAFSITPKPVPVANSVNSIQYIKPVAVLVTSSDSIKMISLFDPGVIIWELYGENLHSATWLTPSQDVLYATGSQIIRHKNGSKEERVIWNGDSEVVSVEEIEDDVNLLVLTQKRALEITPTGEIVWEQAL